MVLGREGFEIGILSEVGFCVVVGSVCLGLEVDLGWAEWIWLLYEIIFVDGF
jgi:hypothetical protein